MNRLVDYGSESEGSDSEDMSNPGPSTTVKTVNGGQRLRDRAQDDFFDPISEDSTTNEVFDRIPQAALSTNHAGLKDEDDLEDFLVTRKKWEVKLGKKEEKRKREKDKKKTVKIEAFGKLSLTNLNYEEDTARTNGEQMDTGVEQQTKKAGMPNAKSGLLALLPKPKAGLLKAPTNAKAATILLPNALQKPPSAATKEQPRKQRDSKKPMTNLKRPLVDAECSDSDSDGGEETTADFFGLSSKMPTTTTETDGNGGFAGPSHQLIHDAPLGPAKAKQYFPQSYASPMDQFVSASVSFDAPPQSKVISNEDARKMIFDKELAPYGVSSMVANDAVANIIDVSVDQALGPNVRENLLKGLNNRVMAQVALGPLPKIKKDPKDKLSKQKHQITYLAGQAVAREEQLQEQWAESRAKKRKTSQKYGF